jgi:hypothetical protein
MGRPGGSPKRQICFQNADEANFTAMPATGLRVDINLGLDFRESGVKPTRFAHLRSSLEEAGERA